MERPGPVGDLHVTPIEFDARGENRDRPTPPRGCRLFVERGQVRLEVEGVARVVDAQDAPVVARVLAGDRSAFRELQYARTVEAEPKPVAPKVARSRTRTVSRLTPDAVACWVSIDDPDAPVRFYVSRVIEGMDGDEFVRFPAVSQYYDRMSGVELADDWVLSRVVSNDHTKHGADPDVFLLPDLQPTQTLASLPAGELAALRDFKTDVLKRADRFRGSLTRLALFRLLCRGGPDAGFDGEFVQDKQARALR